MATVSLFDCNMWYRVTSNTTYAGQTLDVMNSETNSFEDLDMQPVGDSHGQYWQLSIQPSGYCQLCTQLLGPNYLLGLYKDNYTGTYHPDLDATPAMGAGVQQWNGIFLGSGVYVILNQFSPEDTHVPLHLGVAYIRPILGGINNYGYWTWTITEIQPIDDETYSSVPLSFANVNSHSEV
jgi:hypothetical protein